MIDLGIYLGGDGNPFISDSQRYYALYLLGASQRGPLCTRLGVRPDHQFIPAGIDEPKRMAGTFEWHSGIDLRISAS